ncbi:P-loop containing nucleoside triphosphate hydrolase protein [Gigaspora margarita]|uniref:P-loop containing nucleoside triphosphate hydrolase protein n=1 Tax=Gigaspora margarita TaxID=4874 RepID=A0A8H4ESP1_GIGMA|nr:P-loop containing nucleoside triphosphate hydrolase protein [Gigaspora margarita]
MPMLNETGLCGPSEWGPIAQDGLDLTPCAREILLNATLPLCVVIIFALFLVTRACWKRPINRFPSVFDEQLARSQGVLSGYIPISIHDIVQLILSIIQLGFIGFLLGWRINDFVDSPYDNDHAIYWFIGVIGQFISWLYIIVLIACHFMTRRNQTQYAFIKQLLILYTLLFIIACLNLRSIIRNDAKNGTDDGTDDDITERIVFIFAVWNVCTCGVLFVSSFKRPRNPELMYTRNKMISRDTIASLWSFISFSWMAPIIKLSNGHDLTVDDLWELPFRCQVTHCYLEFDQIQNTDLLTRLLRANYVNLVFFIVIAILRSIFSLITPFFLYRLLVYMSDNEAKNYTEEPYIYVFGILCSELASVVFLNQLNYQMSWLNIRVEQMLSLLMYEKQLCLKTTLTKVKGDRSNNVLTTEVYDIAGFFSNLPFLLTIPLEIIAITIFLYYLLGVSSIVGVVIMIACLWYNKRYGKHVNRLQKRVRRARSGRVNEIFELLNVVRTIKMLAWERSFHDKLMLSRQIELDQLQHFFWRTTLLTLLVHLTQFFVTLLTFSFYTIIFKNHLTAPIVFTGFMLFNILKQSMQLYPDLVAELKALVISVRRIEKFLNEIEIQKLSSSNSMITSIGFTGVNVAWKDDIIRGPNDFVLKNINLKFPIGTLSLVCGHKSSGKTLLLLSLLRETSLLCGTIHFPTAKVAYVPQQPWLENSTIRENILFGSNFEEERYWNVVDACGLLKDFENMEQADFTEYNNKDLELSDEQKARVALARTLYSDAQFLLLDDFLSIMDSTTARQIIKNCIKGPFITGRTVIIVTYYIRDLLDISDYIVILGGGTVIAQGTSGQMLDSEALANEMFRANTDAKHDQVDTITQDAFNQTVEKYDKKIWATYEVHSQVKEPFSLYFFYIKSSGGLLLWIMLILLLIIIRVLMVGETYWLKEWSDPNSTLFELLYDYDYLIQICFIAIYILIASISALFIIFRMACQLLVSIKGSKTLFSKLLNTILKAPFTFFDTAPFGKVMNRFSKDLGIIDQGLVTIMSNFLGNMIGTISILVVITVITPKFLFVSIIVVALCLIISNVYINVSRELKRLQSITRSPVVSWFNETNIGITTIRAFAAERRFIKKFIDRLNTSNRTTYLLHMSNRWMHVRIGSIGALASYCVGIFILWQHASIDASLAGFCMIYALGFVPIVAVLIKDYSVVDTGLKSVEHIKEYVNMPQEPSSMITNTCPPAAWPTDGNIKVFGLTVHYSLNDEPALSDIKFSVKAEEKIGIIGRKGAGKTTLANSFLRLTEATKGQIVIDGIDISTLRLEDLRTRLTIIPQDPILFEGTVRSNLDIREEYNDQDLWESLRRVHLVHFEEENGQILVIGPITSLDDPVNEGGSNFSRGERQLICFARTLLRRSKIVIMDEVTTDLDIEMTNKIQEIIRNEFQHTTVFCISHSFDMIINFDQILVLDEGRVAEFDTPYNLIKNPDSTFRYLCEQTGEMEVLMETMRLNHQEEDDDGDYDDTDEVETEVETEVFDE